ncbi:MAG: hypothetical protein MJK04_36895, partial [Psychrosphaera sp.]|nr:hypothetical protein [Psychrosphaera sp.]
MKNHKITLIAAALTSLFAINSAAQTLLTDQATVAQKPQISTKQRVARQQQQLAEQRAEFVTIFNQAYQTYPALPKGMLESLAYVASRWEHRVPVGDEQSHHKMPQAIGLFGLFGANEAGFTNTLDLVAAHANVDKTAMVEHVETYIMATAAYLEAQLLNMEVAGKSLEASKQVLATMSGLPNDGSEISKYAINSYLYDLFSIQAKGSDANGIMIKAQNVNWGKVFKAKELKMLRAPGLLIDP